MEITVYSFPITTICSLLHTKMLLLDLFINFMYYLSLDYQTNYNSSLFSYNFYLSFLRINLKDCFFQCHYVYSAYFSLLFADIKFYLMHIVLPAEGQYLLILPDVKILLTYYQIL